MPYRLGDSVRVAMNKRLRTWNERLVWALARRKMSKADLARACNIERASVTEWANGKTKDPKLVPFFLACKALNLRPRWLALGEEPIEPIEVYDGDQTIVEAVTRLADHLSVTEKRRILTILQGQFPTPPV